MTKDELVEIVGRQQYERECYLAQVNATRADYGRDLGSHPIELNLPHELADYIWDEGTDPFPDRISLMFSVYDDMPDYGHLMYAKQHYSEFGPDDRRSWWSNIRARLAGPEIALRQPLQYGLWCDFFEDPDTVGEAWAALASPDAEAAVLRAVLSVSGPVPYALKASVYQRLLPDPAWHVAIFQSLLASAFDVFGDLNTAEGRRVLSQLRLPADIAHVDDLRSKLG